jgi:hypothetical protein
LATFLKHFGTEEQCAERLFRWRWPRGFVCPACGHRHGCVRRRTRKLLQCQHCRHQTSLSAGTVFAHSKLPLTTWFLAMYLLTQRKNGISALELKRHPGVSYPTAWGLKHNMVLTDGLACFRDIEHQPLATGGGPASVELPEMSWVNTIIGNVKGTQRGSYHNASGQHLPRYLAEFCYRFNRRFNLAAMLPRLAYAALRTPPMPYRLLKLAEPHW